MNLNDEPTIEEAEILVHGLRELLASEGWAAYRGVVEKQQVARFDGIVLTPLASVDAALEQEYKKGEIAGMRMALQLPAALLESAEETLRALREERERNEAAASKSKGE